MPAKAKKKTVMTRSARTTSKPRPKTIMTINLDVENGNVESVLKNGEKVEPTNRRITLAGVSPNKISLVIPSHSSPGCVTYWVGGRAYRV